MKKIIGFCFAFLFVFLAASCAPSPEELAPTVEFIAQQTISAAPTHTPYPTYTSYPTYTLIPTKTSTPLPTKTKTPTVTPTSALQAQLFEGYSDSVVTIPSEYKGELAYLLINYQGGGNFVVKSYHDTGEQADLIVNTIGNYAGRRIWNIAGDDTVNKIEITSYGKWSIEMLPFDVEHTILFEAPGIYQGSGDDAFFIKGSTGQAAFSSPHSGNFIVKVYSENNGFDLLINVISPYEGTKILPEGAFLFDVKAPGDWTMNME